MPEDREVLCAVEGLLDEAVALRLLSEVGLPAGPVYGKKGKGFLRQRVRAFNEAARIQPWVVLVDLNQEFACAPPLVTLWLPDPSPSMVFRVAVRAIEAWLLADRDNIARYLAVPRALVPSDPEAKGSPKRTLVDLARRSRHRRIRDDIVPRDGSGRSEGELYVSRMVEFVSRHWCPSTAAKGADSLRRCLLRLEEAAAFRQPHGR